MKKLFERLDIPDNKFNEEIRCLMKVKHKNIVRFLGYCANVQGEMVGYDGDFVMADIHQRLLCFALSMYLKGVFMIISPVRSPYHLSFLPIKLAHYLM